MRHVKELLQETAAAQLLVNSAPYIGDTVPMIRHWLETSDISPQVSRHRSNLGFVSVLARSVGSGRATWTPAEVILVLTDAGVKGITSVMEVGSEILIQVSLSGASSLANIEDKHFSSGIKVLYLKKGKATDFRGLVLYRSYRNDVPALSKFPFNGIRALLFFPTTVLCERRIAAALVEAGGIWWDKGRTEQDFLTSKEVKISRMVGPVKTIYPGNKKGVSSGHIAVDLHDLPTNCYRSVIDGKGHARISVGFWKDGFPLGGEDQPEEMTSLNSWALEGRVTLVIPCAFCGAEVHSGLCDYELADQAVKRIRDSALAKVVVLSDDTSESETDPAPPNAKSTTGKSSGKDNKRKGSKGQLAEGSKRVKKAN